MYKVSRLILLIVIPIFAQQKLITNFSDASELGIVWCNVDKGRFLYGVKDDTLSIDYDYKIMSTEVTNKQFVAFLNDAFSKNLISVDGNKVYGYFEGDNISQAGEYPLFYFLENTKREKDINFNGESFFVINEYRYNNHPVTNVTWFGANAFAKFYGFSLPTDLEWEKAARGLEISSYQPKKKINPGFANYYNSGDPYDNGTTPVGFYNDSKYDSFISLNNASPYGAFDMIGNVSEWVNDYRDLYPQLKIFRGGSWQNKKNDFIYYLKGEGGLTLQTDYLGFRCVKKEL